MRRPQPKNDNRESNVVVIAAGCMAAFAFIMLFLCCCLRGRRNKDGLKNGQRDDRPLLNFCSSDLSTGSSNSKFNNDLGNNRLGNSIRNDFSSVSSVNNLSIRSGTILDEGRPSDAKLPLPPGRATQLPLPLPPGRVAPPPPEPPSPPPPPLPPPPPPTNTTIPKPPPALPIHKPPPPPPTRNGLPPPPAPNPPVPRAPPPPKIGGWPPPTPLKPGNATKPPKIGSPPFAGNETNKIREVDSQKAKLKPFFWDKVSANTDHSMVWHEIKAGSFQFNEEMMENLFGYTTLEKKIDRKRDPSGFEGPQFIQLIDAKKAQNLSILLKALNVTTEEICDAINEGNELPIELIETLLKLAPTTEEELKLRLFSDDLSQLGPAERFLKVVVDVPFAFKRLESLLFMCSLQEEVSSINESLSALEVACKELKNCRLFLKLLEAVLKTGNRMNNGTFRGGAQAFKLDTLLKLSDVKGTDGKTTLLHFVVLEIIRSEGIRAARSLRESHSIASVKTEDLLEDPPQETADQLCSLGLQVVSDLSNELANVRKAALIDGDTLTAAVSKLGFSLKKSKDFLKNEMSTIREESEFYDTLDNFLQQAEHDVIIIQEEEKRIMSLVKSAADYFHGTSGKDEGLRLFMIVRDFLVMLDKVCKEVKNSGINPIKIPRKEAPSASPRESHQPPSVPA